MNKLLYSFCPAGCDHDTWNNGLGFSCPCGWACAEMKKPEGPPTRLRSDWGNASLPVPPSMETFVKGWPALPYGWTVFLAWMVGMCMGMWVAMRH